MPKECAVCKQPAVVAARITRGSETNNTYLCENCACRIGKILRVEIMGSNTPSLPKGYVLDPNPKNEGVEKEPSSFETHESSQISPNIPVVNSAVMAQETTRTKPMKALMCEMCGSHDIIKQDGLYVCQACGTKYSVEEARKMMFEGTVEVQGTVKVDNSDRLKNLYTLARRARDSDDSENASKYYNEISIENPNSWEAQFYKVYYSCINIKIAQMGSACIKLSKSLDNVMRMINASTKTESDRNNAYKEVYAKCMNFHIMILNNMMSSAKSYSADYALDFMKEHGSSLGVFDTKLGDVMARVGLKEEALVAYKASNSFWSYYDSETTDSIVNRIKAIDPSFEYTPEKNSGGCYIATAVYGSYDCPQVWTLRRYRDYTLAETWYGRAFIHFYYAISPTIVRWYGNTEWFKKMWKSKLDCMVSRLKKNGIEDTPYEDRKW